MEDKISHVRPHLARLKTTMDKLRVRRDDLYVSSFREWIRLRDRWPYEELKVEMLGILILRFHSYFARRAWDRSWGREERLGYARRKGDVQSFVWLVETPERKVITTYHFTTCYRGDKRLFEGL